MSLYGLVAAPELGTLGTGVCGSSRDPGAPASRKNMGAPMDATKPYKFIGVESMDATTPCKFIGCGAADATKPYKSRGLGAMDAT